MGVVTKQVRQYSCDRCHSVIDESQVYSGDEIVLWSNRDVIATANLRLEIDIPYSSQPNACCRKCALVLLREFTNKLEADGAWIQPEEGATP